MKRSSALMALAMVCIMVTPAFSMPADKGKSNVRHDGCPLLINNLTEEQLNNMTLGQLQEMRQRAWQNATIGQVKEWRQNKSDDGCRGCMGPEFAGPGVMGCRAAQNGAFNGYAHNGTTKSLGMTRNSLLLMLMDDLSVDKLNNMTLNQIEELQQTKVNELNNMTLNQIKVMLQNKLEAQNNMTLRELRKEDQKLWQIAGIMGFVRECNAGNSAVKSGSMSFKNAPKSPA
jgi:hypothetical protein